MTDRRHRQKEARARAKEARRKAAARRELLRRVGIALGLGVVVALVLLVPALLRGGDEVELPSEYAALREQPTACGAEAPPPETEMSFEAPIDQGIDGPITAIVDTSCGPITILLDGADYPQTVNSFVFLAREGFYDGTAFHRIAEGFVIQGGDPLASGRGGPGYRVPDEFPAEEFVYEQNVVAMANGGRGTTGSQFFIVVGDQAEALPNSFNVLGRVTDGFDSVERIASVPTRVPGGTREKSYPEETVYIESITIEQSG